MPTQSPLRWEPFIVKLEAVSERGDADLVAANLPWLTGSSPMVCLQSTRPRGIGAAGRFETFPGEEIQWS
ncbi:MAG: hypothetical protein ACYSUI_23180, partial [Planctomycetota bacterium]|jgi:hypothetical protein